MLPLQPASRVSYIHGPRESLGQILSFLAVVRNGEHSFMPLLLSKVNEVLPQLVNPILLNAPENSACNVDIFDGFGSAGIAQPPCIPMEEYGSKFAVPRHDEYKSESSPSGSAPSSSDLSSPYVSSPPLLTPVGEYPHGLQSEFTSMSDMVISPMGSTLSTSGGMSGQRVPGLQAVNHSLGQAPNININGQGMDHQQNLNGVLSQGLNITGIPTNGMMVRQQAVQRSNTFIMPPPPPLRTVGDFQALQRANSDMSAMGSLGLEMDFNTLR